MSSKLGCERSYALLPLNAVQSSHRYRSGQGCLPEHLDTQLYKSEYGEGSAAGGSTVPKYHALDSWPVPAAAAVGVYLQPPMSRRPDPKAPPHLQNLFQRWNHHQKHHLLLLMLLLLLLSRSE